MKLAPTVSLLTMKMIDKELVEALRRSKARLGYLSPIVRDQNGNIISGRHRKYADANWPTVTREVKDDLEREILAIHYNIQRIIPREETQNRLLRIAKILEQQGVKPGEVSSKIISLTGLSRSYVYELLPEQHKRDYAKESPPADNYDCIEESWNLEYFRVPLIPEKYKLVKQAVEKAKESWDTQDDGEALYKICKQYLEGREQ